ncbi:MAG: hypothetical protein Q7R61_02190 [bacterium]|nr:hypothetical protein [bacterium]
MRSEKIRTILIVFAAVLGLDLFKFFMVSGPTLVNWNSWPHWVWVLLALGLLFLAAIFKNRRFIRINIAAYLIVALLAAANHYFPFSAVLTYNCFLFNLILVSIYFFSLPSKLPSSDGGNGINEH